MHCDLSERPDFVGQQTVLGNIFFSRMAHIRWRVYNCSVGLQLRKMLVVPSLLVEIWKIRQLQLRIQFTALHWERGQRCSPQMAILEADGAEPHLNFLLAKGEGIRSSLHKRLATWSLGELTVVKTLRDHKAKLEISLISILRYDMKPPLNIYFWVSPGRSFEGLGWCVRWGVPLFSDPRLWILLYGLRRIGKSPPLLISKSTWTCSNAAKIRNSSACPWGPSPLL